MMTYQWTIISLKELWCKTRRMAKVVVQDKKDGEEDLVQFQPTWLIKDKPLASNHAHWQATMPDTIANLRHQYDEEG